VWAESESKLHYNCRFTANQFVLSTSHLRLTADNFFQLNTCDHSPYITSSLTTGWVCRLQLLLALVGTVNLRFESRGLMTTFYCLRFETSQIWRARPPYLYPPATGWPSFTPRHWIPVGAECWENIYKNSVRTSQETYYVSATNPNRLMLFEKLSLLILRIVENT
jgi:hypothetical protein